MSQTSGIKLEVKPEELEIIASEAENHIQNLKNELAKAEQVVTRSTSYWEAEGNTAYLQSYRSKSTNMGHYLQKFSDHITDLRTIAGIYKEAESKAVEISQSLESDVIV